jgi:ketosteroid isomerase-like protein
MSFRETEVCAQIEKLEEARYDAMIAGDIQALEDLLDDDMTYAHSSGVVGGKCSYLKGIANRVWDYRSVARSGFTTPTPAITVVGDTALVFARLDIHSVNSGREIKFATRTLAVWVRRGERWRLLALHSGGLPDDERTPAAA